jgi:hypothetical protein
VQQHPAGDRWSASRCPCVARRSSCGLRIVAGKAAVEAVKHELHLLQPHWDFVEREVAAPSRHSVGADVERLGVAVAAGVLDVASVANATRPPTNLRVCSTRSDSRSFARLQPARSVCPSCVPFSFQSGCSGARAFAVEREGKLEIDGLLGPQRAVIVEDGDALRHVDEVGVALRGHPRDKIQNGLPRRPFVPRRERIGLSHGRRRQQPCKSHPHCGQNDETGACVSSIGLQRREAFCASRLGSCNLCAAWPSRGARRSANWRANFPHHSLPAARSPSPDRSRNCPVSGAAESP